MKRFLILLLLFVFGVGSGVFPTRLFAQEKTFTLEELAKYNGKDGAPAYYAYEGIVYDVSKSPLFKLGLHFGHEAGKDLTNALEGAPHGDDIVKSQPVVGKLVTTGTAATPAPATVVPVATTAPEKSLQPSATPVKWYEGRIRIFGFSILAWTGFLLAVTFILNFATCFALPWSKFPLPWEGSRPGPDPLDINHTHLKWAQVHKYFAWATVVIGIIHGVIGFLQVLGVYL